MLLIVALVLTVGLSSLAAAEKSEATKSKKAPIGILQALKIVQNALSIQVAELE